jgi:cytochrome c
MFSTKKTLIAVAVAASFSAGSALAMGSNSGDKTAASSEKINGKWAANYREIIEAHDGKYLDREVMEKILGSDVNSLQAKLDPNNPYSYEVDDSIDGGSRA